ncbi:MAG: sigma-70 family RNA polymerase sigma factor [Chitinophagaceae bacterium]|nr:sigma-70 family RNA polymerase sigma factor [Chitinophagaceae bacterium]
MQGSNPGRNTELFNSVAHGDGAAFKILVEQFSPLLYTFIFRITRNQQVAEEVMQDVFIKLWQTRETLAEVKNFEAWLFVISRNHSLNALEKMLGEKRRQFKFQQSAESYYQHPELEKTALDLIDEAVNQLPPQQKKVWVMHRRLRMQYEPISKELGISKETVNKHLQAATQNITNYLKAHASELILLFFFLTYHF